MISWLLFAALNKVRVTVYCIFCLVKEDVYLFEYWLYMSLDLLHTVSQFSLACYPFVCFNLLITD